MQTNKTPYPHLSIDQPAAYRITVQGWVSICWEHWFGGLSVTHLELAQAAQPGTPFAPEPVEVTILTGQVEDQAALLGTLQRLYAFGLPILSLELVPTATAC
jgi:hypothetical protein